MMDVSEHSEFLFYRKQKISEIKINNQQIFFMCHDWQLNRERSPISTCSVYLIKYETL